MRSCKGKAAGCRVEEIGQAVHHVPPGLGAAAGTGAQCRVEEGLLSPR